MEWQTSDKDIQAVEELLLPYGAHFPEDARNVIRCWHSTDVAACPGSGKTTVLLAKLKLLADRMPLECGAGICVLSHTNVAVDEIKQRLSDDADKLLNYPNYIGTIQSFVDRFLTIPYLRNIFKRNIHVVDDFIYAQRMLNNLENSIRYSALNYIINLNFKPGGRFKTKLDYIKDLHLNDAGALCIGKQNHILARPDKKSANQFRNLINDILRSDGIIRYQDSYLYAKFASKYISKTYAAFFEARFRYVFIDEYQDCDNIQRQVIDSIFNSTKCNVFKIGDSDQAIYNSDEDTTPDWIPQPNFLPIMTSCRFNQEIADVVCKLKRDGKNIVTLTGETGVKPVLLVFSPEKPESVITGFISALEDHGLYDNNGVYKAIGAIKNEASAGLKVGSYWPKFDSSAKKKSEHNYWALVDEITNSLIDGQLYEAELTIRKLMCQVFHYTSIKDSLSGKDYTLTTLKKVLDEKYREPYRQWIYETSQLQEINRYSINQIMRQGINELLRINSPRQNDIFTNLPALFLDDFSAIGNANTSKKNIWIEPLRGRQIEFDTIHGVKGETHDATLYLETDRKKASDLSRILYCFGVGRQGSSPLYDYSRKLAYVGMSRPRKLLCVAMQGKTYEKSNGVFDSDWEVVDLRE